MKKICLFSIILLVTFSITGQTKRGKVFLKNGSIIKGKITEMDDSESIQIRSAGNLWVFQLNEINEIDYALNSSRQEFPDSFSKYTNHTQAGVMIGNSENSQTAPFFLHSSINYKVDEKIQVGIGTGVEFLKETHLPVFANFEYRFRNSWFSPYIFLKAGYCFPIEDSRTVYYDIIPDYYYSSSIWPGNLYNYGELKAKGGILFNPGFGITNMFSQNFGMSFSAGYRFSRLHYTGDKNYKLDVDFNRLSITLGIIFN